MSLFSKIKNLIHDDAVKPTPPSLGTGQTCSPEILDSPPEYTFIEALHAARQGNIEKIQAYLNFNPNYARCKSWDEKTLLHEAVIAGRLNIVKLLLESGARVNALYKSETPLHHAIESDLHHVNSDASEELIEFKKNRLEIIQLLLSQHADLNQPNQFNELPIHLAAKLGQSDLVALFIAYGSEVDTPICAATTGQTHNLSRTPLLLATRHLKNPQTVQVLLEKGANPNYQDVNPGYAALHYVAAYHLPETERKIDLAAVTTLLLTHHADVNLVTLDSEKYSPLHLAIVQDHPELLPIFIEHGADVYAQDAQGRMAMGLAAHLGKTQALTYLLDIGVDVHRSRATFYAAACPYSDAPLRLLLSRGVDINRPASNGHTPMFEAVTIHSVENFKFLLDHGGDTGIHAPGLTLSEHAFACWGTVACLRGDEDVPEQQRQYAANARQLVELLDGFKIEKPKHYF
jgi:ankyrin repeat protein